MTAFLQPDSPAIRPRNYPFVNHRGAKIRFLLDRWINPFLTRHNMLDRGHSLRFQNLAFLRDLLPRGLDLRARKAARISGLGLRLMSLKEGEPRFAQDIARGKFVFSGVMTTATPLHLFNLAPPTQAWAAALHSLNWLNHFVASGQELNRIVARLLVEKWASYCGPRFGIASECHALMALSQAAHFLAGEGSAFTAPFFAIVEKQIRRVSSRRARDPNDRLLLALSLLYASVAFRTSGVLRDEALARFCSTINQVILPDGGHITRDPLQLLETLLIIIPVMDAMQAHHQAVPRPMSAAVERMVPMLRMLCHGDQDLCNFQGAGRPRPQWVKSILDRDKVDGRPLILAPHSGYGRLSHRNGLLIVDLGAAATCNSPLALEFSDGQHRIFSSCGMPLTASAAWREAASSIAAHNTLEVNGFSTPSQNPRRTEVITSPHGSLLKCGNHVSAKQGGIIHERSLFLSHTGKDLRGEESLSTRDYSFIVRFHLHTAVRASSVRNGSKIVLLLPNRAAWIFSSSGGVLSLEESVFLGEENGPRRTQQIVIRSLPGNQTPVKWALRRMDKTSATAGQKQVAAELPF